MDATTPLAASHRQDSAPSDANCVRFLLDGQVHVLRDIDPTTTLLELLRYQLHRTGTKEGCAEGDCGACTVLVGEFQTDRVAWRALNACILFAPMLDGRALLTVESLARNGRLAPAQQAMVELHGSQCGFCTPGFVMSLHGSHIGALGTEGAGAGEFLAGNLCRCTGYGPILAAAAAVQPPRAEETVTPSDATRLARSEMLALNWRDPASGALRRWFSPRSKAELDDLLLEYPDARLVAGATDVGLWVTKQLRTLETIIFLGECADLQGIDESDGGLVLGAGVKYSEALPVLHRLHPQLGDLVRRIGAVQVRNAGTIGGNIANGSPIGDMPPALIALGAQITLRHGGDRRTIPLEDYFLAYGSQDRRPGEFLEQINIPRPDPASRIRIVKLSKRFDSDISAVCGAFVISVREGVVEGARLAFGGMAATPKRAAHCEAALIGKPWSAATTAEAADLIGLDFNPLTDVRGTAAYRLEVAANLIRRLWREHEDGDSASLLALEAIDA